jgi:hypothetical protein
MFRSVRNQNFGDMLHLLVWEVSSQAAKEALAQEDVNPLIINRPQEALCRESAATASKRRRVPAALSARGGG